MSFTQSIENIFKQKASAQTQSLVSEMQQTAFEAFRQLGLPTLKNEEWKYTSLRTLSEINFEANAPSKRSAEELLGKGLLNKLPSIKMVFVNGNFQTTLSETYHHEGIIISTLQNAITSHPELVQKHLGKYVQTYKEGMLALNTALMTDGLFVYVPAGKQLELPLLYTQISDAGEHNTMQHPRNLIVLEENASATIIENYIALGQKHSFTNVINEIFVGADAHLEHYKVQRAIGNSFHNNYTQLFQEKNTAINQVTLTLDGQWVRNNLHFYMNGENCNSLLYGLYITAGNQFVDNHSRVDHAMPNCFSDEKYKGILRDASTAVFNGKIMVHKDAQKTNAYQRNQNILLSNEATVNTKPQLEIFADDVKCTHGATIGQLDEEPMFYLRSRGISEKEAKKLLLNAFADDIAEKIKIPELVQILEEEIERKI